MTIITVFQRVVQINTIISTLQMRKLSYGDLKCLLKVTQQVNNEAWLQIRIHDPPSHVLLMMPPRLSGEFLKHIFLEDRRLKSSSAICIRNVMRLPARVYSNLWREGGDEWENLVDLFILAESSDLLFTDKDFRTLRSETTCQVWVWPEDGGKRARKYQEYNSLTSPFMLLCLCTLGFLFGFLSSIHLVTQLKCQVLYKTSHNFFKAELTVSGLCMPLYLLYYRHLLYYVTEMSNCPTNVLSPSLL